MDCNNGSIWSKIEMTNYSKLRVELWSISQCGHWVWHHHSHLASSQSSSVRICLDCNLGLALSGLDMSSKLTQSYEDNLIVENQTNSFLFSNLLNNHHRIDQPFVEGVSIIQIIFQIRIFIVPCKTFEFIYIISTPFSLLVINLFCSW